jgi:phosphoglycolate phosphatase-like HAD superfamily hydrolase
MNKKLVLFDIDGTLLKCGWVWIESYLESVREALPDWEVPQLSFGGKTDYLIARQLIAARFGTDLHPERDLLAERIVQGYISRVQAHLDGRVKDEMRVLPGVPELLRELERDPRIVLSVLTGNIIQGARLKLAAAGLEQHLDLAVGAFGSDHWDRVELPRVALERAASLHRCRFEGKDIVIIGDTVHDMTCGRHLGVRTVAVGTGHPDGREAMLAEKPDHFFEDFRSVADVLSAIAE